MQNDYICSTFDCSIGVFRILDKYILKAYLPLLAMTFVICWFVVLMQFLWRYVEELVGKGLSLWVVTQTVFYAAMSLVPFALPLGILLASLMYFGQIGERLELLAMKASGLPLYRIMAPIFATVVLISGGLLYFQNTYMITSQVKMWTLLYSARYATPELEIPEGVFYSGIPGYSIYVAKRDKIHAGRLYGIMIYDHKGGNDKTRIIHADSGRIVMDSGQEFLTWRLYGGKSFEHMGSPNGSSDPMPTAYAKERFSYKEIVIHFDANFKMHDESDMSSRFVGKNLDELSLAIDTAIFRIDSIRETAALQLADVSDRLSYSYNLPSRVDTSEVADQQRRVILGSDTLTTAINIDSMMSQGGLQDSIHTLRTALSALQQLRNESESRLYIDKDAFFNYRTNRQEWHRKFTYPVACLVFFFIGAPLGAIIRRGGIGVPVVVSVLFFIIYYIIDTFGHNMISSEKMEVVPGMWISTWVLLPIGTLLTWQATRDSASLNMEAYVVFYRKLMGMTRVRKLEVRELILEELDKTRATEQLRDAIGLVEELLRERWLTKSFLWGRLLLSRWINHPVEQKMEQLHGMIEGLVGELMNSRNPMVVAKLQDMPILMRRIVPIQVGQIFIGRRGLIRSIVLGLFIPVSLPLLWMFSVRRRAQLRDLKTTQVTLRSIIQELEV